MTSAYQRKLPIWSTLGAAYREWRRMLPALRPLVIDAFVIVLAISVLDEFIPARLPEQEPLGTAISLVEAALRAFLLAPILIAIHRFIILDEITKTCGAARRAGVPKILRLAVRVRGPCRVSARLSWRIAGSQCHAAP